MIFERNAWDRGETIACRVRYAVAVDWIPFVNLFYENGAVTLEGVSTLRIEPYKSRWEE